MWWRREKQEIAEFLYGLLVADAAKGYARAVSERMGIPYPTLSKYWLGKRRFPAALVKPLFLATEQDQRVAEFFLLGGSDYTLERKSEPPVPEDLGRAVLQLQPLAARISEIYLEATENGGATGAEIGADEAENMRAAVLRLIAHAETLRAASRS